MLNSTLLLLYIVNLGKKGNVCIIPRRHEKETDKHISIRHFLAKQEKISLLGVSLVAQNFGEGSPFLLPNLIGEGCEFLHTPCLLGDQSRVERSLKSPQFPTIGRVGVGRDLL